MKYTIHGFSQKRALELKLDNDHLLLLRWIIDFRDTNQMKTKVVKDNIYYWISYETLCEELPIIASKKDTMYRKLKHLVSIDVLKHITEKNKKGTFSYYGIGLEYQGLISDSFIGDSEKNPNGYGKKSVGVRKKIRTKDSSTKDSSIKDKIPQLSNHKERDYEPQDFEKFYKQYDE